MCCLWPLNISKTYLWIVFWKKVSIRFSMIEVCIISYYLISWGYVSLKNVKTWRNKIPLFFYYWFKTNWSWQYYSIFSNGNKIKNQVIAFRLILGVASHTYRKTYCKSRANDYTSQQTRHIYLMFDQCCPSVYDVSRTLFRNWVDVSCLLECLTFFIALSLAFMMRLTSSDVQAHVYLKKCSQQVFSDNHFKTKGNVGFGHLLFYPKLFLTISSRKLSLVSDFIQCDSQ